MPHLRLTAISLSALVLLGCAQRKEPVPLQTRPVASDVEPPPRPPETRVVRLSGYGKAFYDADVCDLSFSVITIAGDDLTAAFDRHKQTISDISAHMIDYGGSETVCGVKATLLRRSERQKDGRIVEEYRYETDYAARVPINDDIAVLQRDLVGLGVNEIASMELRSARYADLLKQARSLAVGDARSKADYIAAQTGWGVVHLVDLELVGEDTRFWGWNGRQRYGNRAMAAGQQDSSFETFIDAHVHAHFLMERPEK